MSRCITVYRLSCIAMYCGSICTVRTPGALAPVQPRKTRPYITESLLMGRNESNQTSTSCAYFRLKLTATSRKGVIFYDGRNYFTINLHESMRPGCDQTRDTRILSQTRICSQTRYRLPTRPDMKICGCSNLC